MELNDVVSELENVQSNYLSRNNVKILNTLKKIKELMINENNQLAAKMIWCYESILFIQKKYVEGFNDFKSGKFYEGWCELERAENAYHSLYPHFKDELNSFSLEFIFKHIIQYQELFPYKMFLSLENIVKEKKCNICGQIINIRKSCGHKVGEIYDGERCIRIITDVEFLAVSLVEKPLNKYTVTFIVDEKTGKKIDHYDYSIIEFIVERLESPFHNWDYERTEKRYPHEKFKDIDKEENCPCGSKRKYKDCCLKESGVLRPHIEVYFSVKPNRNLPSFVYTY